MSLQNLPVELLHLVITHLALSHPPSLSNLALVNKFFYALSLPILNWLLCHEVRLHINQPERGKQDTSIAISKLQCKLEKADSLPHVRRLVIFAHAYSGEEMEEDEEYHETYATEEWKPPRIEDLSGETFQQPRYPLAWYMEEPQYCPVLMRTHKAPQACNHDAWKPLISMIQKMSRLEDLIYASLDPFPPILLDALEEYQPTCKLHLHAFRFGRLTDPEAGTSEFRLVTSPLLYSIALRYQSDCRHPINMGPCYQKEALLRVLQLAPNLKEVSVNHVKNQYPPRGTQPLPKFTELTQERESDILLRRATLTSLMFDDNEESTIQRLGEWSRATDFSFLEFLAIDRFKQTAIEFTARNYRFSSLKGLRLSFWGMQEIPFGYVSAVGEFLQSLPSLEELCLLWHSRIPVKSIVEHHGSHLRRLHLTWPVHSSKRCLSESDIIQIATDCVSLEELKCKIHRTQGDASEVRLYRALGSIPRLKSVCLNLCLNDAALWGGEENFLRSGCTQFSVAQNARPLAPSDPNFDDFDKQESKFDLGEHFRNRNSHVQRFLVNNAVDEELACDIFRAIASSKAPGSSSLQSLVLLFDESYGNIVFDAPWQVESNPRDDSPYPVAIPLCPDEMSLEKRQVSLRPHLLANFRRVWPPDGEGLQSIERGEGLEEQSTKRGPIRYCPRRKTTLQTSRSSYWRAQLTPDGVQVEQADWWYEWYSFPLAIDLDT